ncbi:hypothetical protein SCUP234_01721 [Seiridium cupressi]
MDDPRMPRLNEKSIIGAWKSKERSLLEMNVEMTSIFTRALEALEMYVDQCSNIHRPVACLGLLMVMISEVYRTFTSNEKGTPKELPWGDTSGFYTFSYPTFNIVDGQQKRSPEAPPD